MLVPKKASYLAVSLNGCKDICAMHNFTKKRNQSSLPIIIKMTSFEVFKSILIYYEIWMAGKILESFLKLGHFTYAYCRKSFECFNVQWFVLEILFLFSTIEEWFSEQK